MQSNTEFATQIGQRVAQELGRRYGPGTSIYEVETGLREILQEIGQATLTTYLETQDEALSQEVQAAPGGKAKGYAFHSYRPAVIWTVFGKVTYRRRYYRHLKPSAGGRKGSALLDDRLGLKAGAVTPLLAELLALEGVSTPFAEAARKLEKLLLIQVSDNTVRKATEEVGRLQAALEAEWIEQSQDTDWLQQREREGQALPGRIYGSIDGFMVPLQEGWKEFKVLAWYEVEEIRSHTPRKHHRKSAVEEAGTLQATAFSCHCAKATPDELGALLWATGCQRQADFYQERVFLGDGARWIWNLVERHYPDATQILDWYHAVQYLYRVAEAAFEAGSEAYTQWIQENKTLLWEGEVAHVMAACEQLSDQPGAAEAVRTTVTFYRNNARRMDYRHFREAGYLIGSGTIESAAKRLGTLRLKVAGARWTEEGAVATAKARAAWLSNRWPASLSKHRQGASSLPLAI